MSGIGAATLNYGNCYTATSRGIIVISLNQPTVKNGSYFYFSMVNWLDVVGSGRSFASGGLFYIYQYRNGAFVKAVTVKVWDNYNGIHSRYDQNWGAGNRRAGDVLYFSQYDIPITSPPSQSIWMAPWFRQLPAVLWQRRLYFV